MRKMTGEVWDPERLAILVLITMFCMHKVTGEVWDTYRLIILYLKTLFCNQNPQMRAGTHRYNNSLANHAILHAQNHR